MLRWCAWRRCAERLSIPSALAQLESLHLSLVRRDGAPAELKSQARYLLASSCLADGLAPGAISEEQLPAFASQVAALVSPDEAPSADFFARLAGVFDHHLRDIERDLVEAARDGGAAEFDGRGGGVGGDGVGGVGSDATRKPMTLSTMRPLMRDAEGLPTSSSASSPASMMSTSWTSRHDQQGGGGTAGQHPHQNAESPSRSFSPQQPLPHTASSSSSSSSRLPGASLVRRGGAPKLCASVIECIVALAGPKRCLGAVPASLGDTLRAAQSAALKLLERDSRLFHNTPSHQCTPRQVIAFLRGADVLLGGPASFAFAPRGVPPLGMLPVKSKADMEHKLRNYPVLRELVRALEARAAQVTRIDAHVILRDFAVIGLFNQPIIDACVERVRSGIAVTGHLQAAVVVLHLGVLGYRHVAVTEIVAAIDTAEIGAHGMRKLLRGMAMLQLPLRTLGDDELRRRVHNHIWMYVMRPDEKHVTGLVWHIEVAHALAALQAPHNMLILRTSRQLRHAFLAHNRETAIVAASPTTTLSNREAVISHLQRCQVLEFRVVP